MKNKKCRKLEKIGCVVLIFGIVFFSGLIPDDCRADSTTTHIEGNTFIDQSGTLETDGIYIGQSAGIGSFIDENISNIGIGYWSGANVDGAINIAIGTTSGNNVIGSYNTATGSLAGNNVTGVSNLASGTMAGINVTGDTNVATGYWAVNTVTGSNNIAIGYDAGNDIEASNTIAIGTSSRASADNALAIGTNAVATAGNSVALGTGSTDGGRANTVSVGAVGAERTISNVAAGVLPTDAVNVSQLSGVSNTFNSKISRLDRDLSGGIAAAAALMNVTPYVPGATCHRCGWGGL